MKDEPKHANPAAGGSYVRDPETGELTRIPDEPQAGPQSAPDRAAQEQQPGPAGRPSVQPDKGRGKRSAETKE